MDHNEVYKNGLAKLCNFFVRKYRKRKTQNPLPRFNVRESGLCFLETDHGVKTRPVCPAEGLCRSMNRQGFQN